MKKSDYRKILIFCFFVLILVSVFFRYFNLNWGAPYYFHPDERNIASAIARLEFPDQMNPDFFAYGSFPIYTAYFLGVSQNIVSSSFIDKQDILKVTFEQGIINLRIISASLSVLIIYLVFRLIHKNLGFKYAALGSLLTGFNVGLIQYAHFGTFEIWLTFLFTLLLTLLLEFMEKPTTTGLVSIAAISGMLVSVKISSLVILPIVVGVIAYKGVKKIKNYRRIKEYKGIAVSLLTFAYFSFITIILTSPYFFLDTKSFLGSMRYESEVALGAIDVFYSGGFKNTLPIIYQLVSVYPFIFNPLNLALIIFLAPFLVTYFVKRKSSFLILSVSFFLVIFFSQAFFFVKWTRYYIPTLPFLIIILILGFHAALLKARIKIRNNCYYAVSIVLIATSIIFSYSYYKTVLLDPDTRVIASHFAEENISKESKIISEIYDMGIVPFNDSFSHIKLFDFYALDVDGMQEEKEKELQKLTSEYDYLILPSQRLIKNRVLNEDDFPIGNKFYESLSTEKFDLIYETECDTYCQILYLGDPIYFLEETSNVFDRPTVQIYKINK